MLAEERIRTIFQIYRLWAGIDKEMLLSSLIDCRVTKEEERQFIKMFTANCHSCKKSFNSLSHCYCDECGKELSLPQAPLLLELMDVTRKDDFRGMRIHGQHDCKGSKFCVYCGLPC